MGIDYVPFDIIDDSYLSELCELHTKSFKSMPYYWATNSNISDTLHRQLRSIHLETCLSAGKKIKQQIHPYWNETRRVVFIARNPKLPPSIRFQSFGTFMPDGVTALRSRWKKWLDASLEQSDYQKELFIYSSIPQLENAVNELHTIGRIRSGKLESFLLEIFTISPNLQRFTVEQIDAPGWFTTEHCKTIDSRLESYLDFYSYVRGIQCRVRRCLSGKWKSQIQVLSSKPFQQFQSWDMGDFMEWLDKQVDAGRGPYLSF